MAYERDDDRVTRGVGAIAAADKVSPGRYRRRIESGIATRKRDRAMAAVANGALSGVPMRRSMGAVTDHRGDTGAGGSGRASTSTPNTSTYTSSPTTSGAAPKPPTTFTNGRPYRPYDPSAPPAAAPPIAVTPPIIAPTKPPIAVVLPPAIPTTVITTGTGPSTQGTSPKPPTITTIIDPVPVSPPIDITPTDNTTRNLMIAGGAAITAYLLFFRRSA
jgi:hypothetical protein